jgi:hypothetical protein
MQFSNQQLEQQLLETAAGQAVYDALVQANIDVRTVPLEVVKRMLISECRYRRIFSDTRPGQLAAVAG